MFGTIIALLPVSSNLWEYLSQMRRDVGASCQAQKRTSQTQPLETKLATWLQMIYDYKHIYVETYFTPSILHLRKVPFSEIQALETKSSVFRKLTFRAIHIIKTFREALPWNSTFITLFHKCIFSFSSRQSSQSFRPFWKRD